MLINAYQITKNGHVNEMSLKAKTPATTKQAINEPDFKPFTRIQRELPTNILKKKLVIGIGAGSGRGFYEGLARCGVENFLFMDHDYAEDVNVATQHSTMSEIGRRKVNALKARIMDINPAANVTAISLKLDDRISDETFESLIGEQFLSHPTNVLICGLTDSFQAQARTANLAMKYGTPYLAAQLYAGGEGGEVYFSYPGVTNSSCPRCALSSRYEAYETGFRNDVTSESSDFFSSLRMNSIEGKVALMLLMYHEDDHSRYSNMLDRVADRNFIQIRMSPFAGEHLGLHVFERTMEPNYSFFDETVWIPQVPNNEDNGFKTCPLCGGTGDLLAIKGTIADTREV